MRKHLLIIFMVLMAACAKEDNFDLQQTIQERPDRDKVIFDYVGLMQDIQESTRQYMENIREHYRIEILIVLLPTLDQQYTVNQAAAEMFSKWKIGGKYQSRGILLLLIDDIKTVKMEVGFELEDVFTDMFCGYVEDLQLQPRYSAGELEIGMLAVMEELEARAQVKLKGRYSREEITEMDTRYLSQGAGARKKLEDYPPKAQFPMTVNHSYPAGETPRQAWQSMIRRWRDKTRDPWLEVFTPLTRLTYRNFTNLPDSNFEKEYRTYAHKSYQILKNGDYAVVYFGKKKGWDNAPFLLCRTRQGWQFDLVHQRRFIRMGPAPKWGVEFSEHPHMGLLMDSFLFRGQDIPLQGQDLYTIDRDAEWANQILENEAKYPTNPNDFENAMALGRLYTLVSMSRKGIKMLKKAKILNPQDPRPYKYLAIGHVNAHYQYDTALKALQKYLERQPQDDFGYNFKGYIYYRKKAYHKAAEAFEKALTLNSDNCYAHFYLAHTYARLHNMALKLDPKRSVYKERFNRHKSLTRSYASTHPIRVRMLNNWLSK